MLFVPASIPPAAAEDYEIPAWSKNNAGWSVDQQITDRYFVKGIKYLMDKLVLETPTNQQSNEYGVLQKQRDNKESAISHLNEALSLFKDLKAENDIDKVEKILSSINP